MGVNFPTKVPGARHERRAATANPNTAYAVCVTEARLLIEDVFPADARPSARSRRGLLSGCRFAICACRCFWRCGLGLIFLTRVVLAVLVILAAFLLAHLPAPAADGTLAAQNQQPADQIFELAHISWP